MKIGALYMTNKNQYRLLSLISSGIDSPAATYLMLDRGADVDAVYFDNRPFTDEKTRANVIDLVTRLREITDKDIRFYVVPHGENQKLIARNCNRHVGCILCRRMMLRLAEQLARRNNAVGLVTGESLGQVASQTLQNIFVETQAVNIPIIRPLIGLDKIEIEKIAQKIGTFEISIRPGLCCTIVPDKPSTNADLTRILREEEKLDIDAMVERSLAKYETL